MLTRQAIRDMMNMSYEELTAGNGWTYLWEDIIAVCETALALYDRAEKAEAELKIARGLAQPGTVDRGSFAQYVEGDEDGDT